MRKTLFNWINDNWKMVKNHCRTTDNKGFTENEPTPKFIRQLLISEHTPIRLILFNWSWKKIPYWLSTEWSRHKFEKYISTQRDDRTDGLPIIHDEEDWPRYWNAVDEYIKEHGKLPRGKKLQETPVNFDGFANMQNVIDAWRKRMCRTATDDARELAEDFKETLHETHPMESDVLVPNCVYRMGCPEFHTCGYIQAFIKWIRENKDVGVDWMTDIQLRYDLYNEYFYMKRVASNANS